MFIKYFITYIILTKIPFMSILTCFYFWSWLCEARSEKPFRVPIKSPGLYLRASRNKKYIMVKKATLTAGWKDYLQMTRLHETVKIQILGWSFFPRRPSLPDIRWTPSILQKNYQLTSDGTNRTNWISIIVYLERSKKVRFPPTFLGSN